MKLPHHNVTTTVNELTIVGIFLGLHAVPGTTDSTNLESMRVKKEYLPGLINKGIGADRSGTFRLTQEIINREIIRSEELDGFFSDGSSGSNQQTGSTHEGKKKRLLIQAKSSLHLIKRQLLSKGIEVGRSEGLLVLTGDASVVADVLEPADQVLLKILRLTVNETPTED